MIDKKLIKSVDSFADEINILFSAVDITKRKGYDLFLKYVAIMDDYLIKINFNKKVNINVITNKKLKFEVNFINIKLHNTVSPKKFEDYILNSHFFFSFSFADSGPYTLNICYYLKLPILSFKVGIVPELSKLSNSIFLADEISINSMVEISKKIFSLEKNEYDKLISYEPIKFKWI